MGGHRRGARGVLARRGTRGTARASRGPAHPRPRRDRSRLAHLARSCTGRRDAPRVRQWVERGGSAQRPDTGAEPRTQAAALIGDASWSAERRFERVFERLALPGFSRAGRYELLILLGHLGLYDAAGRRAAPRRRARPDRGRSRDARRQAGVRDRRSAAARAPRGARSQRPVRRRSRRSTWRSPTGPPRVARRSASPRRAATRLPASSAEQALGL